MELLAEVAHIGLYSLYFRTLDGRYGMARLEGSTWRFVELEGRDVQVQLTDLFDSLRKNVREGWFGLPGGLRETVPGAYRLAVIAAVDTIAQERPELLGDRGPKLDGQV